MDDSFKKYLIPLDEDAIASINNSVAEKGIEEYLAQQLVYLDCSRIINNHRMMQTIGYPYKREISCYIYALENNLPSVEHKFEYMNKLYALHDKNIEYEKTNPPVWYGGKKPTKLPRRKKYTEQTIAGMGKDLSNSERLKRLSSSFGNLNFAIKLPKK